MPRVRASVTLLALCVSIAAVPRAASPSPLLVGRSYAPLGSPLDGRDDPAPPESDARESEPDEADAVSGNQTHAIYFVPKDRIDEDLDSNGTIAGSLDSMRGWFSVQMRKTVRMDRTATDAYDMSYVRGEAEARSYDGLGDISAELMRRGYSASNKRYLIYAAINRSNVCGEGYYPIVPALDTGRYAAIYMDSASSCGGRDFGAGTAATAGKAEAVAAHEWLHNEGVAPLAAPRHCASSPYHVCTGPLWLFDLDPEAPDVVFPIITAKLSAKILDRERNDYLDHGYPHIANLRDSTWLE